MIGLGNLRPFMCKQITAALADRFLDAINYLTTHK